MLVLNLPFKALMFLTLMRPSLVLFLVLWLELVKDFLKVRCRLALLPFLISCLIWLDLVASLPLIKERILVIILLLHFLSLMLGSVLVLMLPLLVWLTPDLRIKKSLLKCNWTIRKRLPRCKMRLKKRLLAFSRRLHARIRKTTYMHKMRCLLINRRSLLLALCLLWKTPIFPSNSRFPRLCAKCLLKLKRLVSMLLMTKSKTRLARLVLRLTYFISKRRISGMALLILALLQRIFLMSSLMLLLVWLIFFMVLIKLLPILGTISGKTVKLMVLALICLGNNRQDCHPPNCMFSCLQILEAFLWFVLITLLNVTLIILTLSVSRLLNLLLRLVAFLLFLNPQCLASISRWITASSSWKRFCLCVCRALSSIMVICMLTAIRLLLTFVMSLYLLLRSKWMNWHNATMCSPNLILITL